MKHLKTILLCAVTAVVSALLAAQAQVPGVNSTLNSVFTLTYELSTSKPTYSATVGAFTPPATADDVCTLQGSATRTLRVRRVFVQGRTGTATADPVAIILRGEYGPTSGGTSVIIANAAYSSTFPAGTAVAEYYTAVPVPTPITSELIDIWIPFFAINATSTGIQEFDFGMMAAPLFIRGVNQTLAVNLNHITLTSGAGANLATISCTFEWTEDSDS